MYRVYISQGQGSDLVGDYSTFQEALDIAKRGISNGEGSFGIQFPSGQWYDWPEDQDLHDT